MNERLAYYFRWHRTEHLGCSVLKTAKKQTNVRAHKYLLPLVEFTFCLTRTG